ncbi:hypothetical protein CTAYLR_005338 [Chrysophaeum taylorii]|uniref:Uroporphyrinogen decarboxylase n=1 Tax=Chrysophaeum taylorii TaxID=2483200 RepID=A0AAD7U7N7_9STRA|nr:hypothetical protein CTAYLR_005338 [Chrysophaeum taylorii]
MRPLQGALVEGTATVAPAAATDESDLLLRAARGDVTARTPVWLMRQAGRYMKAFRAYSEKYPFRMRSETPEIATELSLQCWRAFGVDGVIMFSDILTILPALGVEFDVVPGKGPAICDTLRSESRVAEYELAVDRFAPSDQLPFVGETLRALRQETEGKTTLVGFVGAPWTLAAYAVEGGASRHALEIKGMMHSNPTLAHDLLAATSDAVARYACHQIENGAQMVQLFESWAHHLSPADFSEFAKPYAQRVARYVNDRHPDVPLIFFANGGSSYLELQREMVAPDAFSALSIDWAVDLATARTVLGEGTPIQGNVDPSLLLASPDAVDAAVERCIAQAGGPGNRHILNLGHGVLQQTPEANVAAFVNAAKNHGIRRS